MEPLHLSTEHLQRIQELATKILKIEPIPCKGSCKIQAYVYRNGLIQNTIHWSELCWRILNKMCEIYNFGPVKSLEYAEILGLVFFNCSFDNHPIDYLYEIYLETQKQKNF